MYKAVLVGADFQNNDSIDYYMEELNNLAEASGIEVVYSMTQSISKITANLFIGSGKVQEVKSLVTNLDADMVIFNNELSGSQIRNLEEQIGVRVIDRTLLILDIFASRAKTKEAMLQVEIAQLEYMLPRLNGLMESLGRQQGGIGSKGPGEKKFELDRRRIISERTRLQKELTEIVKSRKIQRKNRLKSNIRKVAIVGYTNAGKSTLVNKFLEFTEKDIDKKVYVENMLFATLETSTRHIILANKKEFTVTDTVGFVSNLPHNLVESFKSTLEEINEADLLIHLVDGSNDFYEDQIKVTEETLKEIGINDIPIIYLYNKSDMYNKEIIPHHNPHMVVSMKNGYDIQLILEKVEQELFKDYETVSLLIPFSEGELVSYFNENTNIIKQEYVPEGTILTLELSPILKGRYQKYIK